ncbi:hypothetical protein KBB12_01300 [Candidatus Woesebacteria bacterium]|nr:hypothetical protein [Candidatus Woesebacteria bacterium]
MLISSRSNNSGSSLMAVIIITVVSITVIGAITILTSLILYSMLGWQRSLDAQIVAESMTDDLVLRLIRDPQMTPSPNESMEVNDAIATVEYFPAQVAGQPSVLKIRGTSGDYVRKTELLYVIENGKPHILSRQETH